jgi:(S)-2-hydroxyglutarate dehydrogenase
MEQKYDVVIIGGGIVGIATAYNLQLNNPLLKITILEKENVIANHQIGNNSSVIHSGIYYKPESAKAKNCIDGYSKLLDFCQKNEIEFDICGKVIVQTTLNEEQSFNNIFKRGKQNNLDGLKLLTSEQVQEIEPHVKAIRGIFVPQTGIIDYRKVSEVYLKKFKELGGTLYLNTKVIGIKNSGSKIIVHTTVKEFETNFLINCAGLYSDKITKMSQPLSDLMIIPFKGEYYKLKQEKEYLVKNLIYPVPNPDFPFLGVHFTRMIKGGVEAGPNAVLAFKREGYKRWDIDIRELFEVMNFPGFRKIASKYWDEGIMEMKRYFSKKLFVKAMQEMIPEIQEEDVERYGARVRAQACDIAGNLLDDFRIEQHGRIINVCNAPSPAATSSLAIGEQISNYVTMSLNS